MRWGDRSRCESAKLAPPRVIERRQIRQVRDRRQVAADLEQHAIVRLRAKIFERRNLEGAGARSGSGSPRRKINQAKNKGY